MKIFERIVVRALDKVLEKYVVRLETFDDQITSLKSEIKKLNSRVSFLVDKIEKMSNQQDNILCQTEQILFNASGSFDSEEPKDLESQPVFENKIFRVLN